MRKSLLIAAFLLTTSTAAFAGETKPAVTDKEGNPVRSTNGNCVRHVFENGQDICAPAPVAVVAPAPAPAPEPVAAPAPEPVALLTREALTVYFDFNKSTINAEQTQKLNTVVAALIASRGVESLSLVGYADRIGKTDSNLKLSERRTKAVQDYLATKVNIPTNVLQADSRGEEGSVTSCDDKQKRTNLISCLAADRRVEIVLNYLK